MDRTRSETVELGAAQALPVQRRSARPPRLVLRFAIQAALVLAVAAAAILIFAREYAVVRAERAVRFHAGYVANTILRDQLRPSDFAATVSSERRRSLDRLFRSEILVGGALRAELYGRSGLVSYSTDPSLMGRRANVRHVSRALADRPASAVARVSQKGSSLKVLDVYVPIRLRSGAGAAGVFELAQDYRPVESAARDAYLPVGLVLAGVLATLYVSLFPMLRRATRRLRDQVDEIRHQALHDSLTDLPNRALFHDRVEQALLYAQRTGSQVAVMLIDLDRFKDVNDTLGHQSGDALLRAVATRLQANLRKSDTVARLGGDEFAVLATNISDESAALRLAESVREAVAEPRIVGGVELESDASVGIALFPRHGTDVDTLLRHADVAMYLSKELHAPALYAREHDHYSPERLALASELRRAITGDEIVVYYQPQASALDGRLVGVEALARWQHPQRGLLGPEQFIQLAETTGLIRPLTRYVLDSALRQICAWQTEGIHLDVAVNITGRDLLDLRFADEVAGLLDQWRVAPERLELEITENTILTDPARAREVLNRLSALGVRLAIDDFGSGHSSLGYLKRLPVDVLKIDKSFVLGMHADENDAVIVRSTIDLGHNLGLEVIAEGVESVDVWNALTEMHCNTIQGYVLSPPVATDAIAELVRGQYETWPLVASDGRT